MARIFNISTSNFIIEVMITYLYDGAPRCLCNIVFYQKLWPFHRQLWNQEIWMADEFQVLVAHILHAARSMARGMSLHPDFHKMYFWYWWWCQDEKEEFAVMLPFVQVDKLVNSMTLARRFERIWYMLAVSLTNGDREMFRSKLPKI